MKAYFRRVSPRKAMVDLWEVWRGDNPHRWPVLGVAAAASFSMFMIFLPDSERIEPRPPEVTYITTFAPDRSEQEIIDSNEANQRMKEALAAEEEARIERRKDLYRALGRATGLDVDQMEAEIERERDSEQASEATVAGE